MTGCILGQTAGGVGHLFLVVLSQVEGHLLAQALLRPQTSLTWYQHCHKRFKVKYWSQAVLRGVEPTFGRALRGYKARFDSCHK